MRPISALLCLLLFSSCMSLPSLPLREGREGRFPENFEGWPEGELRLHFPDVGQGDATLLQSPNGKYLLIDAGPLGAGRGAILPLLRSLKVEKLDALLVTHYDLDHLGGVPSLLAGEDGLPGTGDDVKLEIAYDRGGTPWDDSPGLAGYLSALEAAGVPRQALEAGHALELDAALDIEVLAANGVVKSARGQAATVDLTPATYAGKENAASIALSIRYGGFHYLTAGDLTGGGMMDGFFTPDVESLVGAAAGRVDVLHVNHHGSLSSSTPAFVAATAPRAVVVQAGRENAYGHPDDEVLARWREIGAEIHSTAEVGGLRLETSGSGFEIGPIGNF